MASLGYYSIEVQITNYTQTNFSIQVASLNGAGDSWITGEQPTVGGTLNEYQSMPVGVLTNDQDGQAGGIVVLKGLGSIPVTITFQIPPSSQGVSVTSPPELETTVKQRDTGEQNHAQYSVTIVPAVQNMLTRLRAARAKP
ncbi:hypothetical protein WME79_17105 [Sorangium sp. So ce726]|uniref:hypothetical protein n=1 Tax=Sorangium sp. So ce726 TaxID=3133319 RepID=UPI003F5F7C91